MRISDWSSDVCSSDLASCISFVSAAAIEDGIVERLRLDRMVLPVRNTRGIGKAQMKLNEDRKSVVEGKSVSVRVDLGGRRIIKQKKQQEKQCILQGRHINTKRRNCQQTKHQQQ